MKTNLSRQSAFTLIEVIIAVTIFSLFMGMAIGSYITFHRAQNEAAMERALLLEGEYIMGKLTSMLKENAIDYDSYSSGTVSIEDQSLYLHTPNKQTYYSVLWDSEDGLLTLQEFNEDGEELDGYTEALSLVDSSTIIEDFSLSIFPAQNPYLNENVSNPNLQYQPNVQIDLSLSRPGKLTDDVELFLRTSVTSRFYQ